MSSNSLCYSYSSKLPSLLFTKYNTVVNRYATHNHTNLTAIIIESIAILNPETKRANTKNTEPPVNDAPNPDTILHPTLSKIADAVPSSRLYNPDTPRLRPYTLEMGIAYLRSIYMCTSRTTYCQE